MPLAWNCTIEVIKMLRLRVCTFLLLASSLLFSASITIRQFEHQIWQLTNQERMKEGLQPLLYDEGLADLARIHSRNMLNFGFFAHKDHLGDMVGDRKNKYYPQLVIISIGENLARFFNTQKTYTPQELVDGWMNSPEHRKNILDKDYTFLGVGVVNYGDRLIATQNFATSLVKLLDKPAKYYRRKQGATLKFEYLATRPTKELNCVLRFPDQEVRYKLDEQHYSIGSKPLPVTWLDDRTFQVAMDFPAGKGVYELCFGFAGGYYCEGIKLKVK